MERSRPISFKKISDKKLKSKLQKNEKEFKKSIEKLNLSQHLLLNESGVLEPENEMEKTWKVSQVELRKSLDLNSIKKSFTLDLDFGSYRMDYTRNSRYMLIGGEKGHVAAFDWKSGKLSTEIHTRESIHDVSWCHNSGLFAVAQKKYTFIYDNQGVEIHSIKDFIDVTRLEFLNWHFLLVGSGKTGWLKYQDTSTGKIVAEHGTKLGPTRSMTQNPWNAVIHLGHNNGTVTLWSPSMSSPLVKMLCHRGPIQDLKIDLSGNYMATVGLDSQLKIWDIRTFKLIDHYYTPSPASHLSISQKGILAVGHGPNISLWKNIFKEKQSDAYMKHIQEGSRVSDLVFCPWEDVLGLGHSKGVSSLIIPGSGEPNFDTMEANPYQTSKQRQESEVHSLLEKLAPEMITLDPNIIGNIDDAPNHVLKKERLEEKQDIGDGKTVQIKRKMKGKSSSLRRYLRKQNNVKDSKRVEKLAALESKVLKKEKPREALDRFNKK